MVGHTEVMLKTKLGIEKIAEGNRFKYVNPLYMQSSFFLGNFIYCSGFNPETGEVKDHSLAKQSAILMAGILPQAFLARLGVKPEEVKFHDKYVLDDSASNDSTGVNVLPSLQQLSVGAKALKPEKVQEPATPALVSTPGAQVANATSAVVSTNVDKSAATWGSELNGISLHAEPLSALCKKFNLAYECHDEQADALYEYMLWVKARHAWFSNQQPHPSWPDEVEFTMSDYDWDKVISRSAGIELQKLFQFSRRNWQYQSKSANSNNEEASTNAYALLGFKTRLLCLAQNSKDMVTLHEKAIEFVCRTTERIKQLRLPIVVPDRLNYLFYICRQIRKEVMEEIRSLTKMLREQFGGNAEYESLRFSALKCRKATHVLNDALADKLTYFFHDVAVIAMPRLIARRLRALGQPIDIDRAARELRKISPCLPLKSISKTDLMQKCQPTPVQTLEGESKRLSQNEKILTPIQKENEQPEVPTSNKGVVPFEVAHQQQLEESQIMATSEQNLNPMKWTGSFDNQGYACFISHGILGSCVASGSDPNNNIGENCRNCFHNIGHSQRPPRKPPWKFHG